MAGGGRGARAPLGLSILLLAQLAGAEPGTPASFSRSEPREPCADHQPLRQPYFGDTHVHTALSQDASTQGTINGPRDAYRFARGEALGIQPYDSDGRPLRSVRLERPLDFAVVTDHAEQLGEVHLCNTPGATGYGSWVCRIYRRWPRVAFFLMNTRTSMGKRWAFCGDDGEHCLAAARSVWGEIQAAADEAYDRSAACRFTSFVGYEWTGTAGAGKNLHRNVIFRNATVPPLPVSFLEADSAAGLWDRLASDCLDAGTGCDVLAIPHNSNLSGGLLFESARNNGAALSRDEALRRARFEPLFEVMQHKGDSECPPGAADELCDFEKLPYDSFGGKFMSWLGGDPKAPVNFVRSALGRGLALEARFGANPFRVGLLASTDTHLGTPGLVEEWAHPGHGGAGAASATELPPGLPDDVEFNPGGLAVVWAEENSRDAIFAALRRREVYGTSGTRPILRFFGGTELPEDLCGRPDFVARGYARGVPMGGVLRPSETGPPRFGIFVLQDPGSAAHPGNRLERIQIVKGWLDGDELRERVIEVAGEAGPGADPRSCRPSRAGAASLCTVWTDPDFDARQRAYWYARVVETPSCRWSQYRCNAAGVDCSEAASVSDGFEACCEAEHRALIRERAWTSPIWHSPRQDTGAP